MSSPAARPQEAFDISEAGEDGGPIRGILRLLGLGPKKKSVAASVAEPLKALTPPPPPPAWRITAGNLAAGATAGCVVEGVLYPLDTIKTRLQMMRKGGGLKALFSAGGGRNIYAGLLGNLAGVAPASAIFMAVYEPTKAYLLENVGQQQAFLGAGAIAGFAASFVRAPTEVIKQRMQAGEFKRATTAVSTILAREGPRGMYAGYFAFLLRDLPFDAIEFWAYDTIKHKYGAYTGRALNPGETGAAGAVAGALTAFTTTPLDVLKTRLMTQGSGANAQYKNVLDCAVQIWKQEGGRAFLKGWEPRVIWMSMGGLVFFTALEQAKKAFAPEGVTVESSGH